MNTLSDWFSTVIGRIDVGRIETIGLRVLLAILVLLAAWWISRWLRRIAGRRLSHENQNNDRAIRAYKNIILFVVIIPSILLAIHVIGFDLSSVFTTSGLFAVAIAFAMKNIAENFISGIMIRFGDTIKPGDVLETNGELVRVKEIGLRATTARSKTEKDLLIPNSELVQTRVANYTYQDSVCRVWTLVAVSYASDLNQVREVLERICKQMPGQSDKHVPAVHLTDFGASSVDYKVSVWIENPWDSGSFKSDLNEAIWWALKDAGIKMAFPQLDVHFDEAFSPIDKAEP